MSHRESKQSHEIRKIGQSNKVKQRELKAIQKANQQIANSFALQKEVKEKKGTELEDREDRKIRRYLEMIQKQEQVEQRRRLLKERNKLARDQGHEVSATSGSLKDGRRRGSTAAKDRDSKEANSDKNLKSYQSSASKSKGRDEPDIEMQSQSDESHHMVGQGSRIRGARNVSRGGRGRGGRGRGGGSTRGRRRRGTRFTRRRQVSSRPRVVQQQSESSDSNEESNDEDSNGSSGSKSQDCSAIDSSNPPSKSKNLGNKSDNQQITHSDDEPSSIDTNSLANKKASKLEKKSFSDSKKPATSKSNLQQQKQTENGQKPLSSAEKKPVRKLDTNSTTAVGTRRATQHKLAEDAKLVKGKQISSESDKQTIKSLTSKDAEILFGDRANVSKDPKKLSQNGQTNALTKKESTTTVPQKRTRTQSGTQADPQHDKDLKTLALEGSQPGTLKKATIKRDQNGRTLTQATAAKQLDQPQKVPKLSQRSSQQQPSTSQTTNKKEPSSLPPSTTRQSSVNNNSRPPTTSGKQAPASGKPLLQPQKPTDQKAQAGTTPSSSLRQTTLKKLVEKISSKSELPSKQQQQQSTIKSTNETKPTTTKETSQPASTKPTPIVAPQQSSQNAKPQSVKTAQTPKTQQPTKHLQRASSTAQQPKKQESTEQPPKETTVTAAARPKAPLDPQQTKKQPQKSSSPQITTNNNEGIQSAAQAIIQATRKLQMELEAQNKKQQSSMQAKKSQPSVTQANQGQGQAQQPSQVTQGSQGQPNQRSLNPQKIGEPFQDTDTSQPGLNGASMMKDQDINRLKLLQQPSSQQNDLNSQMQQIMFQKDAASAMFENRPILNSMKLQQLQMQQAQQQYQFQMNTNNQAFNLMQQAQLQDIFNHYQMQQLMQYQAAMENQQNQHFSQDHQMVDLQQTNPNNNYYQNGEGNANGGAGNMQEISDEADKNNPQKPQSRNGQRLGARQGKGETSAPTTTMKPTMVPNTLQCGGIQPMMTNNTLMPYQDFITELQKLQYQQPRGNVNILQGPPTGPNPPLQQHFCIVETKPKIVYIQNKNGVAQKGDQQQAATQDDKERTDIVQEIGLMKNHVMRTQQAFDFYKAFDSFYSNLQTYYEI